MRLNKFAELWMNIKRKSVSEACGSHTGREEIGGGCFVSGYSIQEQSA